MKVGLISKTPIIKESFCTFFPSSSLHVAARTLGEGRWAVDNHGACWLSQCKRLLKGTTLVLRVAFVFQPEL